jgi:hypothetical protein
VPPPAPSSKGSPSLQLPPWCAIKGDFVVFNESWGQQFNPDAELFSRGFIVNFFAVRFSGSRSVRFTSAIAGCMRSVT